MNGESVRQQADFLLNGEENTFSDTYKQKKRLDIIQSLAIFLWELKDSNRRPSACKADALNQLS